MTHSGGRFDFDDGGTYCGGWEDGKAHGQGICTGPRGQGEYAGSWNHGFEVLGVYTWPSGNTYGGNWSNGKRHNLGVETKGKWQYKGEWGHGYKGRYGVRCSTTSRAKYEGTWSNGLQDGYGTETYADGGTYQGQWAGGMRQGSGVRQSMPYGMASVLRNSLRSSMTSLRSEHSNGNVSSVDVPSDAPIGSRGGFVLTRQSSMTSQGGKSATTKNRLFRTGSVSLRKSLLTGLKIRSKSSSSIASGSSRVSVQSHKSYRSDVSNSSVTSDYQSLYGSASEPAADMMSGLDTIEDEIDVNTSECYHGDWKNDNRTGFGVCRRTDGFMYEGEWLGNQRHGYGCTTFPDGTTEEGKYKHNAIATGSRKMPLKSGKIKSKVAHAVAQARRAKDTAIQKSDIASSRTAHSVAKANQAETVAHNAKEEAKIARCVARDLAPDFHQPGLEYMKMRGEDPFKENGDSMYLAEGERNDVAGPESYHQFSNSKTGLTASPVPSRSGSIDANAMDINVRKQILPEKQQVSNDVKQRKSVISKAESPFARPPVEPLVIPPSPEPSKMQYLSPESAMNVNYDPPKSPEKTDSASHKLGKAPSGSLEKVRSPKHSFFKSLRMRSKKNSTAQHPQEEARRNAVEAEQRRHQQEEQDGWGGGSAAEKRRLWHKSMSSPERFQGNSLSRSLCESFDFESNQVEYLTGYEKEMTQSVKNSSFLDDDIDDETMPGQHFMGGQLAPNQGFHGDQGHSHGRDVYTPGGYPSSHVSGNSGSLTPNGRQNLSSPNLVALNQNRGYSGTPGARSGYPGSPAAYHEGHSRSNPNSSSDNSLSMSALSPQNPDKVKQGWQEPPKQCTPAFANYSSPVAEAEKAAQMKLSNAVSEKLSKQQRLLTSTTMRTSSYNDESNFRDSMFIDEDFRSPLPGSLRRRARGDATNTDDVTSTAPVSQDNDSSRTYMVILVLLLNIGFLALFAQFLT